LRRERDAERSPDSKVKRREEGRAFHFQREGPMVAKDQVWAIVVLMGNKRNLPVQRAEWLM